MTDLREKIEDVIGEYEPERLGTTMQAHLVNDILTVIKCIVVGQVGSNPCIEHGEVWMRGNDGDWIYRPDLLRAMGIEEQDNG